LALLVALGGAAEGRMVLVRGEPELPNGPLWLHERDSGGPELERHEISPGTLVSIWEARSNSGQYDLYGRVDFELPPERIELDENNRAVITLTATGSFFGETTCCYLSVDFQYSASGNYGGQFQDRSFRSPAGAPLLGTNRLESAGRKPTARGHVSEFWAGDLEHTIEATLTVNGPRDPGPALSIAAIGNRSIQIVFPYTAVREDSPPEPVVDRPTPADPVPAEPVTAALPAPAGAIEPVACPTTGGMLQRLMFRAFRDWVAREYGGLPVIPDAEAIVLGHALGRVASAVGGDRERHEAFACLELALEAHMGHAALELGSTRDRLLRQAAMGMRDEEVAALTGVTDALPAEDFFAELLP
jgi:hypothetical protein